MTFDQVWQLIVESKPIKIIFLIVLALVVRFVLLRTVKAAVNRTVSATSKNPLLPVSDERRKQRVRALGSMLSSVITVAIVITTVCMIMAELNFNVATLIAGTSILAAVIGFGLQSVMRDFVSGICILFEDQLGLGDYVTMDTNSGTVVDVGLRVTTLRDDDGNLWYVRNGEIKTVANFSQGGTDRPIPRPPEQIVLLKQITDNDHDNQTQEKNDHE